MQVFLANRGADMAAMLGLFMATGASRDKVERFLDADVADAGTVRDAIAADMTNQLLEAFGQTGRQTVADVRRIRARGAWVHLDRRPEE